jgi:hypothetical protein
MSDKRQLDFGFPESEPWWKEPRRCHGCNKLIVDEVPPAPMFRDDAWSKLAHESEYLCFGCMLERAMKRNVALAFRDLKPCRFNLCHRPDSYFDWFLSKEPEPPDLSEWAEAMGTLADVESE